MEVRMELSREPGEERVLGIAQDAERGWRLALGPGVFQKIVENPSTGRGVPAGSTMSAAPGINRTVPPAFAAATASRGLRVMVTEAGGACVDGLG